MKQQLLGLSEAARFIGVTKQVLSNWIRRGIKDIPTPYVRLHMGPIWMQSQWEEWQRRTGARR